MHWSWVIALLACSCPAFAAYYNQLDVATFEVEGLASNANFGFSISSVFRNNNSKLIVGAPLSDLIGSVYLCDLNKETTPCELVQLANNTFLQVKDERYKNHKCWLGGSVKGTDDFFVACAPLYIEEKQIFEDAPPGTYGRCYEYNPTLSELEQMKELSNPKRIKKPDNKNYNTPEETMDTFGWGLDIDSEKSVIVGSPAMSSGRAMKYVAVHNNNRKAYHYTQGKNNNVSINFGYSAASGIFSSSDSIMHAISSTYGNDGHGSVSFLNNKFIHGSAGYLPSEKVGIMFGAVLCTANLSKANKQSDLLVGAPAYATDVDDYNRGVVYIYQSLSIAKNKMEMTRKVEGYATGSMFGSAIANVGDLNGDGIDDIVIAAPYETTIEESIGVVYLYSGANLVDLEAKVKAIQTITSDNPNHRLFGYSLTAIKDYDNNGYNELAVGVPSNNLVMVYRSAAPITIKLNKLPAQVPNDGSGATQTLKVCFEVEYPKNLQVIKTAIKVELSIEHRYAELIGSGEFTVSDFSTKERIYCSYFNLSMPKLGKYDEPIEYTILANEVSDPSDKFKFKTSYVTLSDLSVRNISGSIIASECNAICVPVLKLNQTEFFKVKSYIIGSSDRLDVMVSVVNEGQVAYDACMHVTITGVPLMKRPEGCTPMGQALQCLPKQLIRNNHWNTTISLNTGALTSEAKNVTMEVLVFNHCDDKHSAHEHYEVLELDNDYNGVNVTSVTDEGVSDLVNLTRQQISAGKAFQHVYTISNKGITNWVNVKISVTIQKLPFIKHSVFLTSGQQSCDLQSSTESNETYYCLASELPRGAGIIVKVIMTVVPDELNDRIGKEHLTVHSELTVNLDDKHTTSANVTSELKLLEVKVEIWIYIVAAIFALVILVIFFFILRECGFLRRKNKEHLKIVRMSIRRQTTMRQSMMQRPRSEDLDRLVEDNQPPIDYTVKTKRDRRLVIDESEH